MALGVALVLVGWSLLLYVVALVSVDGLVPGGDKVAASIVVFGPAVVGVVVLVFAALPRLARTTLIRSTVLGPAAMLAEMVDAEHPPTAPDDVVPR